MKPAQGKPGMTAFNVRLPALFLAALRERAFEPVELIDMLITENCNCRCDYCFIRGKRPRRMTEEIVKATIDFIDAQEQELEES